MFTMDAWNFLIAVGLMHCVLFFFDTMFKSCSHLPYLHFLHNTGLQVGVFSVKWFTTFFNRYIQKWGTWRPKLLQCWFTVGSWVSLGLLPLAMYLVLKSSIDIWQPSQDSGARKTAMLEPMVPGYNLPVGDLGYYTFTLITCTLFHEVGHAIAAVREDVHVAGFGLVLLFVLPSAYCQLSTDQLQTLPAKRQLRVLCAGVWHNLVLGCAALLLLLALPVLVQPLFATGAGVSVSQVAPGSPLLGPTGLRPLDRVTAVGSCDVHDTEDWYYCVLAAVRGPSVGHCVSGELLREYDESGPVHQLPGGAVDCCSPGSSERLCFESLERDEGPAEIPSHLCLPGRTVVEGAARTCSQAGDCPPGLHCLRPSLGNTTRLVRIDRADAKPVLFLGHPAEVYQTVTVSDFAPLHSLPSALPEAVAQLCKYLTLFSSGLAILNILPCFCFDGQYITRALLDLLLARRIKRKSTRHTVATCTTLVGSGALLFYLGSLLLVEVL